MGLSFSTRFAGRSIGPATGTKFWPPARRGRGACGSVVVVYWMPDQSLVESKARLASTNSITPFMFAASLSHCEP